MEKNKFIPQVVIDTNVFISYLWGSKNAEHIMELIFTEKVSSVVCEAILKELADVGARPKFKNRFSPKTFESLCEAYRDISLLVEPQKSISISKDKKDNIFLECAFEAEVDYIITGDQHLLEIGNYSGIQILTPAEFLKMIQ